MTTGRPLPGFVYDSRTNRYYREQLAGDMTELPRILSDQRRSNMRKEMAQKHLERVINKNSFDFESWLFLNTSDSPSKICRKNRYDLRNVDWTAFPSPIIINSPDELYPTNIPGLGLVVQSGARMSHVGWSKDGRTCVTRPLVRSSIISAHPTFVCYPHVVVTGMFEDDSPNDLGSRYCKIVDNEPVNLFNYPKLPFFRFVVFSSQSKYLLGYDDIDDHFLLYSLQDGQFSNAPRKFRFRPKGEVRAAAFLSDNPDEILVSSTRPIIRLYRHGVASTSYKLPHGLCASKIWSSDMSNNSFYAQTFHGQIYMFDLRYSQHPWCIADLSNITTEKLKCIVDGDRRLHVALSDLGIVSSYDLRRSIYPHSSWSFPRKEISSIFMAPDQAGLDRLHISLS